MKTVILTIVLLNCVFTICCQTVDRLTDSATIPVELFASTDNFGLEIDVARPPLPAYQTSSKTADSLNSIPIRLPYEESFLAGMKAADTEVDGVEWGVTGFLSGLALNFAGAGLIYLSAAAAGRSWPVAIPGDYSRKAYKEGFSKRAVLINRRAALIGSALGAALQTVLLISFFTAIDEDSDDNAYKNKLSKPETVSISALN